MLVKLCKYLLNHVIYGGLTNLICNYITEIFLIYLYANYKIKNKQDFKYDK